MKTYFDVLEQCQKDPLLYHVYRLARQQNMTIEQTLCNMVCELSKDRLNIIQKQIEEAKNKIHPDLFEVNR